MPNADNNRTGRECSDGDSSGGGSHGGERIGGDVHCGEGSNDDRLVESSTAVKAASAPQWWLALRR